MRCWMRDGRLGRWGGELGGQSSRGVFAIDLRQGTEQEVRDIGQHCGAARGYAVLDDENGQASQEGVDVGSALGTGEELLAEICGEVGFGLRDVLRGVARAEGGVAKGREVAAASGGGAMATAVKGSGIEWLRIHGGARFLRVGSGAYPVNWQRGSRVTRGNGLRVHCC